MRVTEDQLTLYQFTTCPFCLRVRHAAKTLGLNLPIKNVRKDHQAREELISGGGKSTVPCLRIDGNDGDTIWMYESHDIVTYLKKQFA